MTLFGIILAREASTLAAIVGILICGIVIIFLHRAELRMLYENMRRYGATYKMETILFCILVGIVVGGLSGLGIGLWLSKPVPTVSELDIASEPKPEPEQSATEQPRKLEPTPVTPEKQPPAPSVSAPGGIAIGRDNIGTAIVNPPVNPYAPVVTYDFNGTKHVQQGNRFEATAGEELSVFERLLALQKQQDWITLRDTCEAQIKKTPEWLTPYLFRGAALAHMGKREEAIKQLEYVFQKSGGQGEYKDAARILRELRKPRD